MGFLAEHCTIGFFTEEEFEACLPFTRGKDEDMDDFGDDDLGDKFKLFDEDDDEDKD